ncbi:hypothetical protein JHK85_048328 [Glycine max]|nr:hypothetical protein JHK85_048328 [Glycine max]
MVHFSPTFISTLMKFFSQSDYHHVYRFIHRFKQGYWIEDSKRLGIELLKKALGHTYLKNMVNNKYDWDHSNEKANTTV